MARSETWAQLGAELRSVRTLAGLSQRDVVRLTGISQSSVSRLERGDALPSRTEALAWLTAVEATEEARRRVFALSPRPRTPTRPRTRTSSAARAGNSRARCARRKPARG